MKMERKFYKTLKIIDGKASYEYYEISLINRTRFVKCEKILIHTEIVAFEDSKNDKATGIKKTYKLERKQNETYKVLNLITMFSLYSQPVTFINGEPTFYDIKKDD